jgi:hypothetical protein
VDAEHVEADVPRRVSPKAFALTAISAARQAALNVAIDECSNRLTALSARCHVVDAAHNATVVAVTVRGLASQAPF